MRHRKLYYLPGIISIIGLPVLLFFWGPEDPIDQRTIGFNLPSDTDTNATFQKFSNKTVYDAIVNKKIITVDVDDRQWDDRSAYISNQKYTFINHEIERLQFTHDTMSVLKISFGQDTDYGSIVWIINQALIYDIKRYALVNNDMYLFANPPSPKVEIVALDLKEEFDIFPTPKKTSCWDDIKTETWYKWNWISSWWSYLFNQQLQNRMLAMGFVVLILLPSIITLQGYTKRKKYVMGKRDFTQNR